MKRKHLYFVLYAIATFLISIRLCDYAIENAAKGKTFSNVNDIKKNRVGLVLGTSKKLTTGQPNPYYTNRINATVELFKAGKIDYVLVSGDNGTEYYNEPSTIKKNLVENGIPEEKIFLDFAGFRTLDSMVRAREIFGLDSVTVISQKFHNERAIYLAKKKGLTAIGYDAKAVGGSKGIKMKVRESLARVKVFIDLLFNTQPKFLGEKIEII
ncbi:SanA protein [Saonia flava]|uniref:SanA protein n=1 Tax=Saonia flava TaxID=523696 RepID=A0A846QZ38_9FLAO|nr:ElyC/SanA/YdcF family protein [Saonia flava]NJB70915.1 SanA protein [Saonia flava]